MKRLMMYLGGFFTLAVLLFCAHTAEIVIAETLPPDPDRSVRVTIAETLPPDPIRSVRVTIAETLPPVPDHSDRVAETASEDHRLIKNKVIG